LTYFNILYVAAYQDAGPTGPAGKCQAARQSSPLLGGTQRLSERVAIVMDGSCAEEAK